MVLPKNQNRPVISSVFSLGYLGYLLHGNAPRSPRPSFAEWYHQDHDVKRRSFLKLPYLREDSSMIIFDGDRASDSPFVERVWRSHSEGVDPFLSIAVNHCEFVVSRLQGKVTMMLRGPETRATPVGNAPAEGEWVGILLKLGALLPHLPTSRLVDIGVDLPTASSNSFWLGGSVWQFPDYENAETFVERLVREGLLVRDPVIEAALQGQLKDRTQRAVQYRFLQATGITQSTARQIERARYATFLLQHGASIPETIQQAGYYDQPHLTRSLRRFIGQTPAQLLHHSQPEQLSFLYKTTLFL